MRLCKTGAHPCCSAVSRRMKRWADFNATGLVAMVPQAVFNEWTPWEAEAQAVTRQRFGRASVMDDGMGTPWFGCPAP